MNDKMLSNARQLRRNMTKEERHLWYDFLKDYPEHIYRQRVFGRYIVDFYCASAKLAIELDGSQHFDEAGKTYDQARTEYLNKQEIAVLRIPNNEVNRNFRGVCEYIDAAIQNRKNDNCRLLHRNLSPSSSQGEAMVRR